MSSLKGQFCHKFFKKEIADMDFIDKLLSTGWLTKDQAEQTVAELKELANINRSEAQDILDGYGFGISIDDI